MAGFEWMDTGNRHPEIIRDLQRLNEGADQRTGDRNMPFSGMMEKK